MLWVFSETSSCEGSGQHWAHDPESGSMATLQMLRMKPLRRLVTSDSLASLSPSSKSISPSTSPSISPSSRAYTSPQASSSWSARRPAVLSQCPPPILQSAAATGTEASARPMIVSPRRPGSLRPDSQPIKPGGPPSLTALPQRPSMTTSSSCSAASSLSPSSSSPSGSVCDDDSFVHRTHRNAPLRQTERGTAVAAVQFLELLRTLEPPTSNLKTAPLNASITSRAAPAKPRNRENSFGRGLSGEVVVSAEELIAQTPRGYRAQSAHTTEMMLLHRSPTRWNEEHPGPVSSFIAIPTPPRSWGGFVRRPSTEG